MRYYHSQSVPTGQTVFPSPIRLQLGTSICLRFLGIFIFFLLPLLPAFNFITICVCVSVCVCVCVGGGGGGGGGGGQEGKRGRGRGSEKERREGK